MENEKHQILDEGEFQISRNLTDRHLASIVQSEVRYPNYILKKMEDEINLRNLSKSDLLLVNLTYKNEYSLKENFNLFYKKNKLLLILLILISPFPWGTLIIFFSIYFSLKKYSL